MFRQATLFGSGPASFDSSWTALERTALDERSWVDHAPGWLAGADDLFDDLVARLTFRQRRDVVMYDGVVDEPRLTAEALAAR